VKSAYPFQTTNKTDVFFDALPANHGNPKQRKTRRSGFLNHQAKPTYFSMLCLRVTAIPNKEKTPKRVSQSSSKADVFFDALPTNHANPKQRKTRRSGFLNHQAKPTYFSSWSQ